MVTLASDKGFTVIQMVGHGDVSDAQALLEIGRNSLSQGKRWFVVDMREVPYLYSSGTRALLAFLREVETNQGRLVLVGLQSRVRQLLDMMGLLGVFLVANSLEEASRLLG